MYETYNYSKKKIIEKLELMYFLNPYCLESQTNRFLLLESY